MGHFAGALVGAERQSDNDSLDKKHHGLNATNDYQHAGVVGEPPVYIQVLIGITVGTFLVLWGTYVLIERCSPSFLVGGISALVGGTALFICAYSAIGFGHWWTWWTFRWLRGEW
jgi:hypothetical protein